MAKFSAREVSMQLFIVILLLLTPSLAYTDNVVDVAQLQLEPEPFSPSVVINDLGEEIRRGVKARVQLESQPLRDIEKPLNGGLHHYLISVVFLKEKTGKELLEGQVAARTFTPDRRMARTVRLEPQQHQWTGLLELPSEGETMIKVGSKLSDGKKRIYRFFYDQRPVVPLADEPTLPESAPWQPVHE